MSFEKLVKKCEDEIDANSGLVCLIIWYIKRLPPAGIEPATLWSSVRRSPNWAKKAINVVGSVGGSIRGSNHDSTDGSNRGRNRCSYRLRRSHTAVQSDGSIRSSFPESPTTVYSVVQSGKKVSDLKTSHSGLNVGLNHEKNNCLKNHFVNFKRFVEEFSEFFLMFGENATKLI